MLRMGKSDKDFQDAFENYSGGIHRTLKAMVGNESVAEELTQEAFVKAWKGLPQFGFKSSLKTWIYQVAMNVGRDWLRTQKNHILSVEVRDEARDQNDSSEKLAVQEALLELEEDVRSLLILFYYEGMRQDEMSEILNVPEGTIKSRLHTAKSRLREKLIQKGFDV